MRYLVYGAGAVGKLIGGRLALAGLPVSFLARPAVAQAMRREGLRLIGGTHPGHLPSPSVFEDLRQALSAGGPPGAVLLAVKAFDGEAAARQLAAAGLAGAAVVCLINGIGNEEMLARWLGAGSILSAALTTAVSAPQAAAAVVERERGLDLQAHHRLTPDLAADFRQAGFRLRLHAQPSRMKWSKLLTNVVANATSAILGWTPDKVFAHRGLFRLERQSLREVVRVMSAQRTPPEGLVGVPVPLLAWSLSLPPALSQPILRRAVSSGRGRKPPSLSYDVGRGRSEAGWLYGAVVRRADELGLPAPANALLNGLLGGLVSGAIVPAAYRDQPEALLKDAIREGVGGVQGYNPPA